MSSGRGGGSSDRGEVGGGRSKFESKRKDLARGDPRETVSRGAGWTSSTHRDQRATRCFGCGGRGHQKHVCPEQECFRCHKLGHQARSCPGVMETADEKLASLKMAVERMEEKECVR